MVKLTAAEKGFLLKHLFYLLSGPGIACLENFECETITFVVDSELNFCEAPYPKGPYDCEFINFCLIHLLNLFFNDMSQSNFDPLYMKINH